MEERKRRRPEPTPDLDLAGPAAWGEAPTETRRGGARKKNRPNSEPNGKKGRGSGPPPPRARKKRGLFTRLVIGLIWTGIGLGVAGLVVGFGAYSYLSQDLPSTEGLKQYSPPAVTYFFSDDGRVIGEYYHERRFVVPIAQMSPAVTKAFLAVEDARFYQHKGVSIQALIRAALTNFQTGKISSGGSTITQQVVKSFFLTPERSYKRKIKEMILALRLENNFSKDEILFLYLNQIYLGRGAYGVEAAARTYFDKSSADLTVAEAAMLAGITQAPGRNPVSDPEQARDRQEYGIKRMRDVEFITEAEAAAARAEVLNVQDEWPNPNTTVTPYFTEHVRRLMEERVGADSLYNDGWRVFTTVNIEDQRAADVAVARGLWEYTRRRGYKGPDQRLAGEAQIKQFLAEATKNLPSEGMLPNRLYQALVTEVDKKNGELGVRVGPYHGRIAKKNLSWALKGDIDKRFARGDVIWVRLIEADGKKEAAKPADLAAVVNNSAAPVLDMSLEQRLDTQSALLSMDTATGDVKAMVGGRDFGESQFNRAVQSQRQPGSSFKPLVYAAAMDNGFTPGSIMNDAPFVVDDPGDGKRWKPGNSDGKFLGPMTLYSALVGSRNIISIKILDRIGYPALAETARNLGITEKLPDTLTLALGAYGLPIPELLSAYSAFPNMGIRVTPRYITRIEDRYGNVVAEFAPERIPSLDPGTACAVTSMMRGVVAQGTGTSVKPLNRPVGGKTGTTNDSSDAWFIGFTPDMVTAVWVGTDQQRPRAVGEAGGRVAGPIFLYYMREALKDKPVTDFTVPPEAEMTPGGAFGVCYKAGTVGTGLSEIISDISPQDEFLRGDFEDGEDPGPGPGGEGFPGGSYGYPGEPAGRDDRRVNAPPVPSGGYQPQPYHPETEAAAPETPAPPAAPVASTAPPSAPPLPPSTPPVDYDAEADLPESPSQPVFPPAASGAGTVPSSEYGSGAGAGRSPALEGADYSRPAGSATGDGRLRPYGEAPDSNGSRRLSTYGED